MAKDPRITDIRAGLFVLVAVAVLVAGLFWIAGTGFVGDSRRGYVVLMQDSGGVRPGDRVRVAGVAVGKIRDVELRPAEDWPVRFSVTIRGNVPLREDAYAKLSTSGLLGAAYLQIVPGSASEPLLQPGAEIPGRPTPGFESTMEQLEQLGAKLMSLLDQTSVVVESMSTDIEAVMEGAGKLLSDENVEAMGHLVRNLDRTMSDAGPKLNVLLEKLDAVATHADRGLAGLPELEQELNGLLDDLRAAIGPEGQRLGTLLDNANRTLLSAESVLGNNDQELRATVRDLRDTVANLKSFSQTIKERPYSLVRVKNPPERVPGQGVE